MYYEISRNFHDFKCLTKFAIQPGDMHDYGVIFAGEYSSINAVTRIAYLEKAYRESCRYWFGHVRWIRKCRSVLESSTKKNQHPERKDSTPHCMGPGLDCKPIE